MTISHCEGALRPARHTLLLSGDLDATGSAAVMAVKVLAAARRSVAGSPRTTAVGPLRRRSGTHWSAFAASGAGEIAPDAVARLPESILGLLGLSPPAPRPGGARPDRSRPYSGPWRSGASTAGHGRKSRLPLKLGELASSYDSGHVGGLGEQE